MHVKRERDRFKWKQSDRGVFRIKEFSPGKYQNPSIISDKALVPKVRNFDISEFNTEVEWEDSEHKVKEFTFRILSYLDFPEEDISEDLIREQKRLFYFGRRGLKRTFKNPTKAQDFTSPEIIFMLISDMPYSKIGKAMGVSPSFISNLRAGRLAAWRFEYALIYKLREIISKQVRAGYRSQIASKNGSFEYVLYRVNQVLEDGSKKELGFFHGYEKAYELRRRLIVGMGMDHDKLKADGTLNVLFPMDKVTVIGDV